jgi:hypothetical protein
MSVSLFERVVLAGNSPEDGLRTDDPGTVIR